VPYVLSCSPSVDRQVPAISGTAVSIWITVEKYGFTQVISEKTPGEKREDMDLSDEQKIVSIMKENCLHAYLATSDGDQPRVRPVSPIIEDDMSVWVTTYGTSRKVKQIRENPKICLAFVEQPDGDKVATVIGEARVIPDTEEKERVWKLATFDLSQHFPNGPKSDEFCLLQMVIKRIEWRDSWTGNMRIYEPAHQ